MTRSGEVQSSIGRNLWFWGVLAAFWLLMLIRDATELLRGRPDLYPHEHARGLLLEISSLCLALSYLAGKGALRRVLLGVALAGLGALSVLRFTVWRV